MRIYIAGPMRGVPEYNFPAFIAAEERLQDAGHVVFSPVQYDRQVGIDVTGLTGHEEENIPGFNLREAMQAELTWLCLHAEAVVFLPGWEKSLGSRAERATAQALGIPVHELEDFLRVGSSGSGQSVL